MLALCIVGSPKTDGCTALVVDQIIKGIFENGIEVRKRVLGNMNINFCTGCKVCYETRSCVQRDDMDGLIKDMFEADFILIAAPSYWGDVPGQLKVFFDRSTPLCNTGKGGTSVPKGKKGFSVAIRAGLRKEENLNIIHSIEHYFGHLEIEPIDYLTFESLDIKNDFTADMKKKAFEFGKNIRG